MCCQGTFRRRVIQLQAVLARGRHGLRCHEARLIHGRERLSPRNGLVHSSKRTKPCVIHVLPPSISSHSLCLSDNESEVRQDVLHLTWLPFCYDCNVCDEALQPRGQLRHLPCPSAHRLYCFFQRCALLPPMHLDVIRQQICYVHEFQCLDFFTSFAGTGANALLKMNGPFCWLPGVVTSAFPVIAAWCPFSLVQAGAHAPTPSLLALHPDQFRYLHTKD